MKLTMKDVGKTFTVKDREGRTVRGGVQLLTLSADGKVAYVGTAPDAQGRFKGRYEDVPADQLIPLSAKAKGARR